MNGPSYPIGVALVLISRGLEPLKDFKVAEAGDGTARITAWFSNEPQPTPKEVEAALPAAQAALTAAEQTKQELYNQQQAGIVEAKRAYARMQAIIDGVDTATIAQLRLAVKEIARDIQHLIHAAVK